MSARGLPRPCYFQSGLGEQSPSYPGQREEEAVGTGGEMVRPGASWGHRNPGRSGVPSCSPRPGLWDSPLGIRPQGGRAPRGLLQGFLSLGYPAGVGGLCSKKALNHLSLQSLPLWVSHPPPPYSLEALLGCLGVKISRIRGQVQVNKSGGLQETQGASRVFPTPSRVSRHPHTPGGPSVVTVPRRSQPQRLPGRTGAG